MGLVLREVDIGKVDLPPDYRAGMEKLLSEELETEKIHYTLQLKEAQVKQQQLEAEADKVRRQTAAEAAGQEQVIAARAQEETMKHILPFKQKQIEQRQLEAEADKVARIRTAEGAAEARRIEAKGEADSRQKLADAEAYRLDLVGKASAGQMEREGALVARYPLLIQKTLADKLSDKVQVIIAPLPAAGKFIGSSLIGDQSPVNPVDERGGRRDLSGGSFPVILALAATLAIVVQDHAALRAAPRSSAAELTRLWQGDVLEIRGEHAGYLKVYDYRRERGGYLRGDAARPVELSETAAPELLAVLRFLRESPGSEALGISYGAAYLKAVPPQSHDRRAVRRHRPNGRAARRSGLRQHGPSRRFRPAPGSRRTVRRSHAQFRAQRPDASLLRRRIVSSRADAPRGAAGGARACSPRPHAARLHRSGFGPCPARSPRHRTLPTARRRSKTAN